MRLSTVLFQQHIGRMFRDHWRVQGKRLVIDNGALNAVQQRGLDFEDVEEFIKSENAITNEIKRIITPRGDGREKPVVFDETHPDYNEQPCLTYGDGNVLLEGLKQAQVLTNTVVLDGRTLPFTSEILPEQELPIQDRLVRRCIRSSLLFDAWQEKLPKRRDPQREAWNFPLEYGIVDRRRNLLLVRRLLQLCSSFSPQLLGQRTLLDSAHFTLPFSLPSGDRVLFSVRGDAVLLSNRSPSSAAIDLAEDTPALPDISPLAPSVSLESTNFYKYEPDFPVRDGSKLNKIHTVVLHYNETEVANIFETPVTNDQILGRTLLQSWIYAMSQAANNADKSEPVTVQIVHTDSKFFHFGILKLNSSRVDSEAEPNIFWSFPQMSLFETCAYETGVPVLEGYNSSVFKTLLAFYNNS